MSACRSLCNAQEHARSDVRRQHVPAEAWMRVVLLLITARQYFRVRVRSRDLRRRTRSAIVRLRVVLLVLAGLAPVTHTRSAEAPTEVRHAFFIVATNGNDAWSGRKPAANATGSDGPFATLTNALAAARAWRRSPGVASNAVVGIFLRNGVHFLSEPLVLKPQDSGLVLSSYGTEKPVISGGQRITGWRPVVINEKNAWAAYLPGTRGGKWAFHQLWVDGRRAVRARYPEDGYLGVVGLPDKQPDWNHGNNRFVFRAGDFKPWTNIENADAVVMQLWAESRLPIAGIDEVTHQIRFKKSSVFRLSPGSLYYLEGSPEFLEQPGQWALDSNAGILYYLPRTGEVINQTEIVAPVLAQVLRVEGIPEGGIPVRDVRFKGLTFSHTEWYFPEGFATGSKGVLGITPSPKPDVGGFAQADIGVPGAVWAQGIEGCSWRNCTFIHVGGYALQLDMGCKKNSISRCQCSDTAGGIRIGGLWVSSQPTFQTEDNELSDCHIYDGDHLFHTAYAIWVGQARNTRVTHNLVHDYYSAGISIGWTYGYTVSFANSNLVAYNHFHHIGRKTNGDGPIISDLAAIYTLGVQPGTKIVNNLIHDVAGLRYGGWGIYLDEGSSGILVESNIVYRTTHGGFELHFGGTNGVVNNIFAYGRDYQLSRTTPEPHLCMAFLRNIVCFNSGTLMDGDWTPNQYRIDSNLYFDERCAGKLETMRFPKGNWRQWQAMGNDQHSMLADPLFRDPHHGDFELKENSPAFSIHFQPIDTSAIGIRK